MLERYLIKEEISNAVFYICGPPSMLNAMQELIQKQLQITKDRAKLEEFTGY
jgi:glycine betaine catabolism B